MDWTDPSHVEAYLRNWLIELGYQTGLPLMGKDWELAAVAVVALVGVWIWFWPTRRAFRHAILLRWLVLALNIGAIWMLPMWLFALVLSSIRRSTVAPGVPKPVLARAAAAPANIGMPSALADVVKAVAMLAARKQAGAKALGPWGKHAKPAVAAKPATAARAVPAVSPTSPAAASRPAASSTGQRAGPSLVRAARSSTLPNRETWIRRRD